MLRRIAIITILVIALAALFGLAYFFVFLSESSNGCGNSTENQTAPALKSFRAV